MRTRSQSREQRPPPEEPPVIIEPLHIEYPFQEDPIVEPMADTRTMAQLLQAPTEGYEDAILIPEIVANNFELKHGLINLVQNKQFFGHDKEDPHAHIRYFNKITSTMRVPNVPIATIKLMHFHSLSKGAARIWLEKEPPFDLFKLGTRSYSLNLRIRWKLIGKMLAKFKNPIEEQVQGSTKHELSSCCQSIALDKKIQASAPTPAPAPFKAVELSCVNLRWLPILTKTVAATMATIIGTTFPEYVSLAAQANYNQCEKHAKPRSKPASQMANLTDMLSKFVTDNTASTIRFLGTLPCLGKASLPDLNSTCMTLELADRSISNQWNSKDHLRLKFGVISLQPTLWLIGSEAITYNLDQTSRYSANYTHMTANKIDVIDMACEEYSQEVLGFTDTIASGNSTPDSFLGLAMIPIVQHIIPFYYDPEGDILILEAILNSEPPLPPPSQGTYLPEVRTELKGDNKLPVIIAKELDVEEKSALIKVLKSHKRALAWKLSDIQGINPEFCTHKILMEEDYAPAVQHQRRVNPKIHDVIKKEVEKLLEAGLIYPISDSPWVSPIHCVPKKGGMTVVVNEENELIPTRLVTGWRVCIDYRKLNEATRKDHFPLPFMDQISFID
ncbi:hypothetical protein Tco_1133770 [Tanacetum coccineum]